MVAPFRSNVPTATKVTYDPVYRLAYNAESRWVQNGRHVAALPGRSPEVHDAAAINEIYAAAKWVATHGEPGSAVRDALHQTAEILKRYLK